MDGDKVTISWLISDGDTQTSLGDSARTTASDLVPGEYTITVIVQDRVGNEVMEHFTITVLKVDDIIVDPKKDTDLDGMADWYEYKYQLLPLVKDANEDPDGDGFPNIQEYGDGPMKGQNLTNPKDALSHPVRDSLPVDKEETGPFAANMWALWVILLLLIAAVIVTMVVTNRKKEQAIKRIKTVRNMRSIMPSVSWDQITTTAYMAPYAQGMTLPAAAGPALPSAQVQVEEREALPPAQEGAQEAAPVQPQPVPATPEPAPAPQPYQPPSV
jgi:hypothetical protein